MEPPNTSNPSRVNHWAERRKLLHPAVLALHPTALTVLGISKDLGVTIPVVRSCLADLGLPAPDPRGANYLGRKSAERATAKRAEMLPDVSRLFGEGYPVNRIAKTLGMGRATVDKCLRDLGISKPSISEGNRRSAAFITAEDRKLRASAAHAATRRIGESPFTRAEHSEREELSLRYVGTGEKALELAIQKAGFRTIPQAARYGYNIDILVGDVAVEVHNTPARPHSTSQRLCRIVKLLSGGIHPLYVHLARPCPEITDAAIEEVLAFLHLARRNPTMPREYRVVRGDGQIDATSSRQLDKITAVFAAHCSNQTKP